MPNPGPEEPLTKVTININTSDYLWLKEHYGHGYSGVVRGLIRRHIRSKTAAVEAEAEGGTDGE